MPCVLKAICDIAEPIAPTRSRRRSTLRKRSSTWLRKLLKSAWLTPLVTNFWSVYALAALSVWVSPASA